MRFERVASRQLDHREEELVAEGWIRRFVVAPERLDEVVDLYGSLGFEVHLEPIAVETLEGDCRDCSLGRSMSQIVYTRRRT